MKKQNLRCYYSHSLRIYNSERETNELNFLKTKFSKVLCPNNDIGEASKGMQTYLNIVQWADIVAVSEYQGFIGRGVFDEIETAFKNKIPVKLIKPHGTTFKLYDVTGMQLFNDGLSWVEYAKIKINIPT